MKRLSMLMWVLLLPTFAFLSVAFLFPTVANAQNPVVTQPNGATSTVNSSTTVTATGVFQSFWAANSQRMGCTVQNKGGNSMYVFFGAIADATTGKSVILLANQAVNCSENGTVLRVQVSVTGTIGDAFYAVQY